MKDFIEYLIKHLVDKPDEVHVKEIAGEKTVVFELHVGDGDMGKVIGRKGQTARALRTILSAVSAKQGQRSVLEILDPNWAKPEEAQNTETPGEWKTGKPSS
jgi:predicted RNA-binding protein YlqC (UPF0109 family)